MSTTGPRHRESELGGLLSGGASLSYPGGISEHGGGASSHEHTPSRHSWGKRALAKIAIVGLLLTGGAVLNQETDFVGSVSNSVSNFLHSKGSNNFGQTLNAQAEDIVTSNLAAVASNESYAVTVVRASGTNTATQEQILGEDFAQAAIAAGDTSETTSLEGQAMDAAVALQLSGGMTEADAPIQTKLADAMHATPGSSEQLSDSETVIKSVLADLATRDAVTLELGAYVAGY